MEAINDSNSSLKGKCFSCLETSVSLVPSDTSIKALSSCCLFGKVIAPMIVEEINVTDFVAKTWKIPVSVASVMDDVKGANVFKFGFECADHRNWAMENGPWCVRGYSLVLRAWTPTVEGPVAFNLLRTWIQIHNLPHEYFSKANGYLLGGLVGKVVRVDLDEGKPAAWCSFLKVLVDIDAEKPLFSGCYFDIASGVKKWIQRGNPFSHVRPLAFNIIIIPMRFFWAEVICLPSTTSFFGLGKNAGSVLLLPASMEDGDAERRSFPTSQALRSRRQVMGTSHGATGLGKTKRAVWFPKNCLSGGERSIAISGFGGEAGSLQAGKEKDDLLVLEMNSRDQRNFNLKTVGEDKRKDGLFVNGPSGVNVGLDNQQMRKGKSPLYQNLNETINVNGPPPSSKEAILCGPELVESLGFDNNTKNLEGLSNLDKGSNDIGPNHHSLNILGLVGDSSKLPRDTNDPEVHDNEAKALAQFFKAQESLLHDLKHFGNLDLYEIQNIGGDIGVPASSEVNERTTPFKKRKFEASASLCSRPHKVPRKYPDVVRDFPWDTKQKEDDLDLEIDDPSEDSSSSPSCSGIGIKMLRINIESHDTYRELNQALSKSCVISMNTDKKMNEVIDKIGKMKEDKRFVSITLNKANEVKKFHEDTKKALLIEILRFCGIMEANNSLLQLGDMGWLLKFMPDRGDKTQKQMESLRKKLQYFDHIERKVMNTLFKV
ncbi:hypothetical protein F8388_019485 [Cannabis sativa]|uniref:DUF4283 domain-containing protein n=1 Tax=Cannabis sativa TaxID=3483 RepID=A0A7J6EES8_CANSA|nr:hypothetical protein F8388_019485 [Cannabis sativa]KAF4402689.1 hypothetical protein G4B88_012474 [Cannabis sativa]